MAFSNSASPESIWGLGGPEEDHQIHHCCWTGRVGEREEEEEEDYRVITLLRCLSKLSVLNSRIENIYLRCLVWF